MLARKGPGPGASSKPPISGPDGKGTMFAVLGLTDCFMQTGWKKKVICFEHVYTACS